MGAFGFIIHSARAVYGMATDDYDLVDSAMEKGKKSLYLSLIDPIGGIYVVDVVASAIEESTT